MGKNCEISFAPDDALYSLPVTQLSASRIAGTGIGPGAIQWT